MPLFTVYHHENEASLFSSECTVGALNTALMELALSEKGIQSPMASSPTGYTSPTAAKSSNPSGPGEKRSGSFSAAPGSGGILMGGEPYGSPAGGNGGKSNAISGSASQVAKSKRIAQISSLALSLLEPNSLQRPSGSGLELQTSSKANGNSFLPNTRATNTSIQTATAGGSEGGNKRKGSVDDAAAAAGGASAFSVGHRSPPVYPYHYHKLELLPLSYLHDLLNNPKLLSALQGASAQRDQQQQQQQQLTLPGAVAGVSPATPTPAVLAPGAVENSNTAGPTGNGNNNSVHLSGSSAAPDSTSPIPPPLSAFPSSGAATPGSTSGSGVGSTTATTTTSNFSGPPLTNTIGSLGGGGSGGSSGPNNALSSLLHAIPFVGLMTMPVHNAILDTCTANNGYILLGCREKRTEGRTSPFPSSSAKRSASGVASSSPAPGPSSLSPTPGMTAGISTGGVTGMGMTSTDGGTTLMNSGGSTSSSNGGSCNTPAMCSGVSSSTGGASHSPFHSSMPSAAREKGMGGPPPPPPLPSSSTSAEEEGESLFSTVEPFSGATLRNAGYGQYVVEKCGGHRPIAQQGGGGASKRGRGAGALRDRRGMGDGKQETVSSNVSSSNLPLSRTGDGSREDDVEDERRKRTGRGAMLAHSTRNRSPSTRGGGGAVSGARTVSQRTQESFAPSVHSVGTTMGGEGGKEHPFSLPPSVPGKMALRSSEVYDLIHSAQRMATQTISRAPLQTVSTLPSLLAAVMASAAGGPAGEGSLEGVHGSDGPFFGGAGGEYGSLLPVSANAGHAGSGGNMAGVTNRSTSVGSKKGEKGSGRRGGSLSVEDNAMHYGPRRLLTKEIPPNENTSSTFGGGGAGGSGVFLPGGNSRGAHLEGMKSDEDGNGEDQWNKDPFQSTQPPLPSGAREGSSAARGLGGRKGGGASPGGKENRSTREVDSGSPKKNVSGTLLFNTSITSKSGGAGGSARGGPSASNLTAPITSIVPMEGEGEDGEPVMLEVHPEIPLSGAASGLLYHSPLSFVVVMNTGTVTVRNMPGNVRKQHAEDAARNAVAMLLANNPEEGMVTSPSTTGPPFTSPGGGAGVGTSSGASGGIQSGSSGTGGSANGPGGPHGASPAFTSPGTGGPKTHILERMEAFDVLWRGSSGEHDILAWILQEYLKMMKAKIVAANQQVAGAAAVASSGAEDSGKKETKRRRNGSLSQSKKK